MVIEKVIIKWVMPIGHKSVRSKMMRSYLIMIVIIQVQTMMTMSINSHKWKVDFIAILMTKILKVKELPNSELVVVCII